MMKRFCRAAAAACLACLPVTPGLSARAGYTTPGLSAGQLARLPGVGYARPLMETPERTLVVLYLSFPPKGGAAPASPWACHRLPGPVTLRATRGALRLQLEGRPVQLLRAGGTVYASAHSLHTLAENVSNTEPATAVAVVVVPKGAPILTRDQNCGKRPSR